MKTGTIAVALAFFALQPAKAVATFTTYDSGNSGELFTSFPGDEVHRVLYSVNVGSINAGDILIVTGDAEVENISGIDHSRCATQLILGSSAGATTGVELDENNSFNVTVGMDHGVPEKIAIHAFAASTASTYVNFVIWSNVAFDVDQDYGRLQVLKITP